MKTSLLMAALVATLGVGITAAHASSVSLDTFQGSNWTVQRVLVGGESDSTTGTFAVQNVASNPGWASLSDPNAKWVSWNSNTGSGYTGDVNGTQYVYSDTFTLGSFTGAGTFSLSGSFLVDNYATSVTLTVNGNPVGVTLTKGDPSSVLPPTATEFGYRYSIDVSSLGAFTSPEQFVLSVTTVNSYADAGNLANHTNPGPTGFQFEGSACATASEVTQVRAVPTPEAVWAGLSMLGGLGGFSAMRKKLLRV